MVSTLLSPIGPPRGKGIALEKRRMGESAKPQPAPAFYRRHTSSTSKWSFSFSFSFPFPFPNGVGAKPTPPLIPLHAERTDRPATIDRSAGALGQRES